MLEREKQKAAGLAAELQKVQLLDGVPAAGTDPKVGVLRSAVATWWCSLGCTPLWADLMCTHCSRFQASPPLAGVLLAQLPTKCWRAVQSPEAACRAAVEKAAAASEAAQKECAGWKSKHEAALERTNQLEVKVGVP